MYGVDILALWSWWDWAKYE